MRITISRGPRRFYNHRLLAAARITESFFRTVVLVLSATVLVLVNGVMAASTFDHERLGVYRLSIDYVAFSYQIARVFGGANR